MKDLPIDKYRGEIMSTVERNPVTIITAETGAGKSTRVPLWFYRRGRKVTVTQPRRIAARSLADYLAREEEVELGSFIGYQTGLDKKFSPRSSLLYVTDGVQILKEITRPLDYDLLVLDEIHEWNLNQEVLCGVVKGQLEKGHYRNSQKRVVIMSATLDASQLAAFFNRSPVISVRGRGYPVSYVRHGEGFLLSDAVSMVKEEMNTLVFLPGKKEISDFIEMLQNTLREDKLKARIFPLHSELSLKEQARVFKRYDQPKVVVATDVAQTSLTIDDIDAVLDSGLKKELRYQRGVEGLYPVEISQAECHQRAGRGGRTKRGYYILCSERGIDDRERFSQPEIQRINPASIVLRLKKWGFDALDFVFFHTPDRGLIKRAEEKLRIFGALDPAGNITPDGHKMANLPVSVRSARAILEARRASSRTLLNVLRLISILEVRGIVNRDYPGQKLYPESFNSDLYNQLMIWNHEKNHKKIINYKKLTLAKQIFSELKRRLRRYIQDGSGRDDPNLMLRVILSLGADFTFKKFGRSYFMDDIERVLDHSSILSENQPEMITGIPFDLMIRKPSYFKEEEEENLVMLVTFATEINTALLDKIKPFSYRRVRDGELEKNKILIREEVFFGGRLIEGNRRPPDFSHPEESAIAHDLAFQWFWQRQKSLKIRPSLDSLRGHMVELKRKNLLCGPPRPFSRYLKRMIRQKIQSELKQNDLSLFFEFSSGFQKLSLADLLGPAELRRIKKAGWPSTIRIADRRVAVIYQDHRPFVRFSLEEFGPIEEDDLILPTGDRAGVILAGKKCLRWKEAVSRYNRFYRKKTFEQHLQGVEKEASIGDLKKLSFPIEVQKGSDKENRPFTFYVAPRIVKNQVVLAHFFTRREAEQYLERISSQWHRFIARDNARELQDAFKKSDWR